MYHHDLDIKITCLDVGITEASTVINIIEFVLVVLNLFLLPLFVHVIGRLTLHVNLKCIIGSLCYNYIFYLFNRIFFLTVQLDILEVPDNSMQIVSMIYNFVNVYFFQTYLYSLSTVCFERFTATLFLRDYETNKRAFISRAAVVLTCVLSVSGSSVYVFVFPRQMKLVLAVFALAISIIGATIMLKLEHRNKRLLAQFSASRKKMDVPYSLSLRFQLDENIRSTQLIRNLFLLFGISNIVLAPVYAATIQSEMPGSSCSQKIMESILHFIIVFSATEVPFVALCSHQQYRELATSAPVLRVLCRKKKNAHNGDEGSLYFQNLSQQWK